MIGDAFDPEWLPEQMELLARQREHTERVAAIYERVRAGSALTAQGLVEFIQHAPEDMVYLLEQLSALAQSYQTMEVVVQAALSEARAGDAAAAARILASVEPTSGG